MAPGLARSLITADGERRELILVHTLFREYEMALNLNTLLKNVNRGRNYPQAPSWHQKPCCVAAWRHTKTKTWFTTTDLAASSHNEGLVGQRDTQTASGLPSPLTTNVAHNSLVIATDWVQLGFWSKAWHFYVSRCRSLGLAVDYSVSFLVASSLFISVHPSIHLCLCCISFYGSVEFSP